MPKLEGLPEYVKKQLLDDDLELSWAKPLGDYWFDDGVLCVSSVVSLKGGVTIYDLWLMYLGIEAYADLKYARLCKEAFESFSGHFKLIAKRDLEETIEYRGD